MRHVAAFLLHVLHGLRETFSDDATGKLSWQAFVGVALVRELCIYVRNHSLTDFQLFTIVALTALLVYGPTVNLTNYFKGIYGGFKTSETVINAENAGIQSGNTNINAEPGVTEQTNKP